GTAGEWSSFWHEYRQLPNPQPPLRTGNRGSGLRGIPEGILGATSNLQARDRYLALQSRPRFPHPAPAMSLDNSTRKEFRSIGHKLHPIVIVKGLSNGTRAELERALSDHELIKI